MEETRAHVGRRIMPDFRRGRRQDLGSTLRTFPFRRVYGHKRSYQTERVRSSSRERPHPPDLRRRADYRPYVADYRHGEPSSRTESVSSSSRDRPHPSDLRRREDDRPYIADYRHGEPSSHTAPLTGLSIPPPASTSLQQPIDFAVIAPPPTPSLHQPRRGATSLSNAPTQMAPLNLSARPSNQHESVSSSTEFDHHDLGRNENVNQICTADIRQRELSTCTGNQMNLKEQVLTLIITDLQTLSLVEEEGFQLFLKALHPCTDAALIAPWIQTELLKMYDGTRAKVQSALRDANHLVVSAEIWTASIEVSYLTVTCHFIDNRWDLKSYVLETAHLLGEHTSDNVHRHLWRILMEWEIGNKVQVVVVNLNRMNKAVPKSNWTYVQCFGYVLNKVFKEVMDNPDWIALLKKCRQVVEILHRENQSWTRRLTQSPALDWLPTLNMVEKICENWTEISTVLIGNPVQNIWLNENERKMLCDAKEALTVLKNVTHGLGKSGYAPVSNIIPLLGELQTGLKRLAQSENRVAQKLAKTCHRHFDGIKQIPSFTVSTALDPRFKTCVLENNPKAEEIKDKLKQELGAHHDGEMILRSYVTDENVPPTQNPLEFWGRQSRAMFKELAPVARMYLSVVSTAVPIERVMQQDQSLIINRRRCLAPEDVDMMLFLNGNQNKI